MSDTRIKAFKNGPLEVSGPVGVTDSAGAPQPVEEDPIYLCRCGIRGTSRSATAATSGWASRADPPQRSAAVVQPIVVAHSSSGLRSSYSSRSGER